MRKISNKNNIDQRIYLGPGSSIENNVGCSKIQFMLLWDLLEEHYYKITPSSLAQYLLVHSSIAKLLFKIMDALDVPCNT